MKGDKGMNRREFVKGSLALAGAAALGNIGMAEERKRKMDKKRFQGTSAQGVLRLLHKVEHQGA